MIAFFEADHRSAYRGMDGFFEGGAMTESNLLMEIDVVAFFDGAFRLGATRVFQRKVDKGRRRQNHRFSFICQAADVFDFFCFCNHKKIKAFLLDRVNYATKGEALYLIYI